MDKTVLANEQVVDGRGWRSGALVERKEIPQWFLKITDYADELVDSLDQMPGWPEQVKTMQRNWIGRSEGVTVTFKTQMDIELKIFTTRVDTLFGVTFLAISPEHELTAKLMQEDSALKEKLDEYHRKRLADKDGSALAKEGIDTGMTAINPLTGEAIPIWIANYVLMDYGSGAIMAVPAHDERDWDFAKKYHIPMTQVIDNENEDINVANSAYCGHGTLINSKAYNGRHSQEAMGDMIDELVKIGAGERKTHFRLKDWSVSRQRYWGAPIPIIYCEQCGTQTVPLEDLPVQLPEVDEIPETSALKSISSFYNVKCPKCKGPARRETDTFDTFFESSWYYARYACVNQDKVMLDDRANYWLPVDQYVGGIEHAILHLLYARFVHKLLRDEGLVNSDEPFKNLLTQGMVLKDGAKMSKSKGNIVSPIELIDKYGADTVRLFVLFAAPPENDLEWIDSGVDGAFRFLNKLWNYIHHASFIPSHYQAIEGNKPKFDYEEASKEVKDARHQFYKLLNQIQYDFHKSQFNTVVSGAMKLLNLIQSLSPDTENTYERNLITEGVQILLKILYPCVPHITTELWQHCAFGSVLAKEPWPSIPKGVLHSDTAEFVIQINGKRRAQVTLPSNLNEERIKEQVFSDENVQRYTVDKTIKKTIVIANRNLVNIVTN